MGVKLSKMQTKKDNLNAETLNEDECSNAELQSQSASKDDPFDLIEKIFKEDESLKVALRCYLEQMNLPRDGFDQLERFKDALKWVEKIKNEMDCPIEGLFYQFIYNYSFSFCRKIDSTMTDIATTFFTKHQSEFNGDLGELPDLGRSLPSLDKEDWRKYSFFGLIIRPAFMELLIKLGFDYNLRYPPSGNTVLLHLIANANNTKASNFLDLAVKYPDKKLDVNIRSAVFGTTALILLVAKGYRYLDSKNEPVGLSNLELAEKLIVNHGAQVNLGMETKDPTTNGMTALHLAAARRDIEFCKLLMKHGANIQVKNAAGQTPLDLLFLTDEEAHALISICTDDCSIYRQFQPVGSSPEQLKQELVQYDAELRRPAQSSFRLSQSEDSFFAAEGSTPEELIANLKQMSLA